MGCVIKCIVRYDRPYWRERGFSGEIVSDAGPLCVCYDKTFPEHNICAIAGLICGHASAQRRSSRGD
jgi:monoamine oxidase